METWMPYHEVMRKHKHANRAHWAKSLNVNHGSAIMVIIAEFLEYNQDREIHEKPILWLIRRALREIQERQRASPKKLKIPDEMEVALHLSRILKLPEDRQP